MKNKLTLTLILLVVPAFAANSSPVTYLALGDSVAFGMNPLLLPPYTTTFPKIDKFVGYPEDFADMTNLPAKRLVNASCPGETSASFLDQNMPDLGCNTPRFPGAVPFKLVGLHTNYSTSQMTFAKAQLSANPSINLVTLTIGANDVLAALPKIQECGADEACAGAIIGGVLQAYGRNLTDILNGIRGSYKGTLILTKYYSPAPSLDGVTSALNQTMAAVAQGFPSIQFADGFTGFKIAALAKGGDACAAGLLIRLTPTTCDEHPSEKGQEILAFLVRLAQLTRH